MNEPDDIVRFGTAENPVRDGHYSIPEWDAVTRAHLWTVGVIYRVEAQASNGGSSVLTPDQVLSAKGPGCWYCHVAMCPLSLAHPCPGKRPGRLTRLRRR
jgi:hypothetical protein